VPQHQPWTNRASTTAPGIVSRNNPPTETAANVSRKGALKLTAKAPVPCFEEGQFKNPQPYQTPSPEEKPTYIADPPQGSFAPASTYSMSERGIDFMKKHEGVRNKAYSDADGYSIGVGHFIQEGQTIFGDTINGVVTKADIEMLKRTNGNLTISDAEINRLFKSDVVRFENAVKNQVTTNITQGQFDAMTSFSYNGGEGALRRMVQRSDLNSGNFEKVPEAWMRLSTCSRCEASIRPRVEASLTKRRRSEIDQLFSQL
jgi:lysozyme